MVTMALVVAAMMSASLSASAQSRRGELVKVRKGDVRKEIQIRQGACPARSFDKRFIRFDRRFDKRFDARFDRRFAKPVKMAKHHKHIQHIH